MRHLPRLHLLLLVLAWVAAVTWGTAGVVVVGGLVLALEVLVWRAELSRPYRVRLDRLRAGLRRGSRPAPSYDAVRHALRLGAHSRREFDFGMRRRLERIASTRLVDAYGVDLHRDPDRARILLGPEAWELLDPRRPVSGDRGGGGVSLATIKRLVDRLERL